jgi:TolB-like protein
LWTGQGARQWERIAVRIGLFATLIAASLAWAAAGAASAQTVRVAMLPVSVNSSSSDVEYLSSGLADMLAARLEQSGQLVIVRLPEAAADRKQAIDAAKKAGAQFVVYGSYTQFGDGASLDLRCAATAEGEDSSEPRRVFIQAGNPSEIIPQLEDLSIRMAQYMAGAAVSTGPPLDAETPSASAETPAAGRSADSLERRVEALEQAVFSTSVADGTSPAQ